MTIVEITVVIDDAAVQPRIDNCYSQREKPPRTRDLVRDLVREGSLKDVIANGGFFAPVASVRVDGELVE